MAGLPFPDAPRRREAVVLACRVLLANQVRLLPPDPEALARGMGFSLCPLSALPAPEEAGAVSSPRGPEEAFTLSGRGRFWIVYRDGIPSAERIRFSVFHEFGHILMRHFDFGAPSALTDRQLRLLEAEADIFARNFICPPPVLALMRPAKDDAARGALFGLSRSAWRVRRLTAAGDLRLIPGPLADGVRLQFRDYMFGRRCRECGAVFTDEAAAGRCPRCGCRFLLWNPALESREEAAGRRHTAGARPEDLAPPAAGSRSVDLTRYWELLNSGR